MPTDSSPEAEVLLRLPAAERSAFKDPLGPVYTDPDAVIAAGGKPMIAVGDVVTATLLDADCSPDVAVVDGHTEREPVDPSVSRSLDRLSRTIHVTNPPATITRSLVTGLAEAIATDEPVRVVVDGEEDLAVVPAVLLVQDGATVVYGQPGRGMVVVVVTPEVRTRLEAMLSRLEGDHAALERLVTDV